MMVQGGGCAATMNVFMKSIAGVVDSVGAGSSYRL